MKTNLEVPMQMDKTIIDWDEVMLNWDKTIIHRDEDSASRRLKELELDLNMDGGVEVALKSNLRDIVVLHTQLKLALAFVDGRQRWKSCAGFLIVTAVGNLLRESSRA